MRSQRTCSAAIAALTPWPERGVGSRGCPLLRSKSTRSCRHGSAWAYSRYRSRGLGGRLLSRALERVELSVLHDNALALALYERLGFAIEGRRLRDWKHGGIYRDSVLMALDLIASR